jgi:guanylate kinase
MRLAIITGPSGVGKSSIVRRLKTLKLDWLAFPISVTTRKRREGEVNNVDYIYVDDKEFQRMVESKEILEWTEFDRNKYGTHRSKFEALLCNKQLIILEVDLKGSLFFSTEYKEVIRISLLPPSKEELIDRLRKRGSNTDKSILRRLYSYEEDSKFIDNCEIKLINRNIEESIEEILKILRKIR